MHKRYVRPNPDLQVIAIAGIHIGNAGGVVGCKYGFSMPGQRNFPAFLPTAKGHEEYLALCGQLIHAHPEGNGGVVSVQLCSIRRLQKALRAVESDRAVRYAKAILRQRCAIRGGVITVSRSVHQIAGERVGSYRLLCLNHCHEQQTQDERIDNWYSQFHTNWF